MSTGGDTLPDGSVTILRATVGSTVHGTSIEGTDDRDEMAIVIEPVDYVIGMRTFETHVYRTQPHGVRSGPGDLDLTMHSLRKFARLAVKGNPTILLLLFVPDEFVIERNTWGERLCAMRSCFLSRQAGRAFLGYMHAQRERLSGERGQMRINRPELVEKYGYDTKYAGHVIRLGIQGVQLMAEGGIALPMFDEHRAEVLATRKGEYSLDRVLTRSGQLEAELRDLLDTSPLPEHANADAINRFLADAYISTWNTAGGIR